MWLFTTIGFFSIVQKPGDEHLTVRSRVASDLDSLRERYMANLSATVTGKGTDYPYRATISHLDFSSGLSQIVMDLHYSNFKSEVENVMGHQREAVYAKVWGVLQQLENLEAAKPRKDSPVVSFGKKSAYGGVVFNGEGKVLLREPKNHWDGYVWTFAKGRPDPGEEPEVTALREVREETGVEAEIKAPIPGSFAGGTTENVYFLMFATKETGKFHWETQSVRWADMAEAKKLINQTTNTKGRERDLKVLAAAVELYRNL